MPNPRTADALTAKMIRRNPLVLTPEGGLRPAEELAAVTPEAVELAWERVKAQERAAAGLSPAAPAHDDGGTGPGLDVGDIPARLPALAAATRVWRDFFPSPDHVYEHGIRFMRTMWDLTE